MIFGANGLKISLKGADINSSASDAATKTVGERSGKNDELFKSLRPIEEQVNAIVGNGTQKYIDGIKENVLNTIFSWFEAGNERFFFLFGNMGTGKSFFSAKLYDSARFLPDSYPPVIYSSQQTYPATTHVENMLLVTAARLARSIPEYAEYFMVNELGEKNIEKLTEKVLIAPFETIKLKKRVLIVIDGLDEYSKSECTQFLDVLTRLSPRMCQNVNIFFSSRPERYIRSHLPSHSQSSEYMIEKQEVDCHADCLAFIRAKSEALGIEISESAIKTLIEKSKYCLKYLQCVFDDSQVFSLLTQEGTVEKLPDGLLSFYREQLIRYFSDERVYREDYLPMLEIICAAYRPMSVSEIADILGRRADTINDLILRAGTLIYKSDDIVYLYQSESIKPYLSDERNCPENFLVKPDNGRRRILDRISELIEDEDLDSNDYLLSFAADHILDMAEGNDNDAWTLLFKLIKINVSQRDITSDLCVSILSKPEKVWSKFIQKLYKSADMDPVIKDNLCSVFQGRAASRNLTPALIEVVSKLNGLLDFRYYELLVRLRHEKKSSLYDEALKHSFEALEIIEASGLDERLKNLRLGFIYDEIQRVQKFRNDSFQDIIKYAAATYETTKNALDSSNPREDVYPILLRNHSVSYDQIGRLFERYATRNLARSERRQIAEKLCEVLGVSAVGAENSAFFIRQAIYCHEKNLELTKRLQMLDSNSKFRLYDLTYPLIALGRLYSNKSFAGRNFEKAVKYLEDCLAICEKLSDRAISESSNTRPIDMRYARAPIFALDELISLHNNENNFEKALEYIMKERSFAELLSTRYPSEENSFSIALTYEFEAKLLLASKGIAAAEPMYIKAAELYSKGAEEWGNERFMRAPGIAYDKISKELENQERYDRAIPYRRKSLEIDQKVFEAYPTPRNEFYVYLDMESVADTLSKSSSDANVAEALELYVKLVDIYKEFAKRNPSENHERAALCIYDDLYDYYMKAGDYETAQRYVNEERELAEQLYERYPNAKNANSVAIVNKYDAFIAIARDGVEQAEARVREIADACIEISRQWEAEYILRIPGYIYDHLADAFADIANIEKVVEYRRLSLESDQRGRELYPTETNEFFYCIDLEKYADALMTLDSSESKEEAIAIYLDIIEKYSSLARKYSFEKYARAVLTVYEAVIKYYTEKRDFDNAMDHIATVRMLTTDLINRNPSAKNHYSFALTYDYEASLMLIRDGITPETEQAYLNVAEMMSKLAELDDHNEIHERAPRFPYVSLSVAFEKAKNTEKAIYYRRKLLAFDEMMLEKHPTVNNEWGACIVREKLAEDLYSSENNDEKLEGVWLYRVAIDKYNALAAKTQNEIHLRGSLSSYDVLFFWYNGKRQFAEAEKYMREERALAESLYERWPNEKNEFSVIYTHEFEALLVKARDGDETSEQLLVELVEKYKAHALRWKTLRAVRSVFRAYALLTGIYEHDNSPEPICTYFADRNKFIDDILDADLDDECRLSAENWSFAESIMTGERLMKMNGDKCVLAAIDSYERAIAIGGSLMKKDQGIVKHVASAIKKLELIFTEIKVMIKFLHKQNNAANKPALLSYLETEIRIINFLKNCISPELFEEKYSEALDEFRRIFESLG